MADFNGTGDPDVWIGSGDNETAHGGGGNDDLDGAGGDDTIYGEADEDRLNGGDGNDTIWGGTGLDHLFGGAGDDIFWAHHADLADGEDYHGGSGNDIVLINTGASAIDLTGLVLDGIESLQAGAILVSGEPSLAVTMTADQLNGLNNLYIGAGTLAISTGGTVDLTGGTLQLLVINLNAAGNTLNLSGANVLNYSPPDGPYIHGSGVSDEVFGSDNHDRIYGHGGDDVLHGGRFGSDLLDGGAGNDRLTFTHMSSSDAFYGGSETDTFDAGTATAAVTVMLGLNPGDTGSGPGGSQLHDIENLDGSSFGDTLTGSNGANVIDGKAGNDALNGGAGNDLLDGGPGDDMFEGGQGDDEIVGGAGQDTLRFAYFTLGVVVDLDAGTITGEGNDTVSGVEFIEGSRFADELTGDGEDNRIYGAGGADIIAGGGGNDELDGDRYDPAGFNATAIDEIGGGSGNDHLVLGLNDIGDGGADFDLLAINLFNHPTGTVIDLTAMWSGGTGTNGTGTVTGFERIYMIAGSSGNDTITIGTGGVIDAFGPGHVLGYGGNDQLTGGDDRDSLHGDDGDDVVLGLGNDDQLSGWDGSDRIEGGAGDDTIDGGRDADILIGGAGSDLYSYHDGSLPDVDQIVEAAEDSGIDTLFVSPDWNGSVADWAFTGVRNVEIAQLRTLQDVAGFEFTLGAQFQAAGFTTLVASADIDASQVTADMNIVVDRPNIRPLTVLSGSGDDHFNFTQYTLPPFVEDYLLDAGAGIDTVYFANSNEAVMAGFEASLILRGFEAFALGPGTDPVAVPDGDDIDGRHQRYSISLSDSIVAAGVSFLVDASALRANFVGSLGSDGEIGGTGANADIVGSDQLVLDASALSADRSVNVLGGAGGDILKGGAGGDTLDGGGGDDELDGGTGNDGLAGGLGNDTYVVDSAGDTIVEIAGEGTDAVYTGVSYVLAADQSVELLTVTSAAMTAAIDLTGNNLANTLAGNAVANLLNGGAGADLMIGGLGNDRYIVDNAGDVATETAGEGTDIIYSAVSYSLNDGSSVESLSTITWEATNAIDLTGNGLANQLIGNAGANRLDGAGGADTMTGREGDDVYVVDNALDKVIEIAGQGSDIVHASVSYILAANADVEALATTDAGAANAINLTGNGLANILTGNAGRNQLDGKAGADTMIGREGNDTYLVDNAGDTPTEVAGQGTDTVYTSVSYTLAANTDVEGLATISFEATNTINLTGNGLANNMIGNDGANQLDGKAGADTMTGRAGNDKYLIDNAGDRAFEAAGGGTDVVYTGVSFVLTDAQEIEGLSTITWELTNAINLTGNSLKNNLIGNAGVNVLDGRAGNDTLQGREGADSYAFTTVLGANNIDVILGFSSADDTILLENNGVFIGLAGRSAQPQCVRDRHRGAGCQRPDRLRSGDRPPVLRRRRQWLGRPGPVRAAGRRADHRRRRLHRDLGHSPGAGPPAPGYFSARSRDHPHRPGARRRRAHRLDAFDQPALHFLRQPGPERLIDDQLARVAPVEDQPPLLGNPHHLAAHIGRLARR